MIRLGTSGRLRQNREHHPRDIPPSYGIPDPTFTANAGTGTATYPSRIYWRKK